MKGAYILVRLISLALIICDFLFTAAKELNLKTPIIARLQVS